MLRQRDSLSLKSFILMKKMATLIQQHTKSNTITGPYFSSTYYSLNIHKIMFYFIWGFRHMDRGAQQRSAASKEKFRDEISQLFAPPQQQQHH